MEPKTMQEIQEGDVLYSPTYGYCTIEEISQIIVKQQTLHTTQLILRTDTGAFAISDGGRQLSNKTLLKFFSGIGSRLYVYGGSDEPVPVSA